MKKSAQAALVVALIFCAFIEVVGTRGLGSQHWASMTVSFAVSAAALLLIVRRDRVRPSLLTGGSVGLAVASGLLTLALYTGIVDGSFHPLESLCLLILIVVMSRRWDGLRASAVLIVLVAAAITNPWRMANPDSTVYMVVVALGAVLALMLGWTLRENDLSTERKVQAVLTEERHDIARDLHDEVAHHVTGIIVAAQAAAMVTGPESAAARAALERIERAGVEALESMRSIVSVLRVPDPGSSARRSATRWPEDLTALTQRFERTTGLRTTLTVNVTEVPTVYCQAVQRVTQEALTNVSRHARNATRTDVVIDQDEQGFRVTVTDDGQADIPGRAGSASAGGGFGLIGVRERACALGGQVRAGRHGSGGWQVEVVLPLIKSSLRGQPARGQMTRDQTTRGQMTRGQVPN